MFTHMKYLLVGNSEIPWLLANQITHISQLVRYMNLFAGTEYLPPPPPYQPPPPQETPEQQFTK